MLIVYAKQDYSIQQTISAKLEDVGSQLQRIVVEVDDKSKQILVYQNNKLLVEKQLMVTFKRNGKMRFGENFAGNLLETRVWSKAMAKSWRTRRKATIW